MENKIAGQEMSEQEILEKVNEYKEDEAFMKRLSEAETLSEIKDAFAEKGINLSDEEIKQLLDLRDKNALGFQERELSEDDLDNVAGGFAGMLITFGCVMIIALILLAIATRKR